MITKSMKKGISILLVLIMSLGLCTAVFAYSNDFATNKNWVSSTMDTVDAKYNNGNKFIIYYYRPETCSNSATIGNGIIKSWMEDGEKIYGLDCDKLTYWTDWFKTAVKNVTTLPAVIFVNNKTTKTIAANSYTNLTAMQTALTAEYNSYKGTPAKPAADTDTYTYKVKYNQTDARTMLSSVNNLRKAGNAWYWNKDNTTKTEPKDLKDLVYDYDLEKTAMQRAAELVALYNHTRPDDTDWWTALSTYTGAGENIAYGYSTASAVQTAWEEADQKYDNQGHRRNMLSTNTAFAAACVEYNGVKFWVQEFRSPVVSTTSVAANDKETEVSVKILPKYIKSKTIEAETKSIAVKPGDSKALPTAAEKITMDGKPGYTISTVTTPKWVSSDTTVATVSDNKVTGVKEGTAKLTISGETGGPEVTVTVSNSGTSDIPYVMFSSSTAEVNIGESKTLTVSSSGGTVKFTSSDPAVATVDDTGKVTGVAAGKATITAAIEDKNVKDICTVTVTDGAGTFEGMGSFLQAFINIFKALIQAIMNMFAGATT